MRKTGLFKLCMLDIINGNIISNIKTVWTIYTNLTDTCMLKAHVYCSLGVKLLTAPYTVNVPKISCHYN